MLPSQSDFKLVKIFLAHSLKLKPKEKLLISVSDSAGFALAKATYILALKMGIYPLLDITSLDMGSARSSYSGFSYQFYKLVNDWQLKYLPKEFLEAKVNWPDAYLRIFTQDNSKELAQINPQKIMLRQKLLKPYVDRMINNRRWVTTIYPTASMAQTAGVAYDWLVDFYYQACLVDYAKMKKQLLALQTAMDKADKVQISGQKTKLTFSLKDRLSKACYGEYNIPDGEVFSAPLESSVEGEIYFDLATTAYDNDVENIYLKFKKGKVVKAEAEKGQKYLEQMLKTDAGAKSIGEFALGANYNIKQVMKNTLFDEKIGGTIHLALGRAYKEKRGGGKNDSSIHWDLVKDTRLKGSKVLFDGKVILKEGKIFA